MQTRFPGKEHVISIGWFCDCTTEWGYPNARCFRRRPSHSSWAPSAVLDDVDDAIAAKFSQATHMFARLCVEIPSRTGVRVSERLARTSDAVGLIGSGFWLHISVGKSHDRHIPLHSEVSIPRRLGVYRHCPTLLRPDRPNASPEVSSSRDEPSREEDGIGHVSAHRLRHTFIVRAINRGMSLDGAAAFFGHQALDIPTIHARVGDKTLTGQYFAVAEIEGLYDRPRQLFGDDEWHEMRKERWTVGCNNTRPAALDARLMSTPRTTSGLSQC